jgi:hypothetical protein
MEYFSNIRKKLFRKFEKKSKKWYTKRVY